MAYLPGSHLIGMRKFINIFEEPEDILKLPEVADIEPVWVEVPRGSVAFHHGLTVHMADANETDRPRAVHTIIYFKDGNTRSSPSIHFAVERAQIPIGGAIASDVTPVVWPRDTDDVPPVPGGEITLRGTYTNPGSVPKRD